MLENHDYPAAAREYEITAYDYPPHAKSAAAGYAAIYAHREYLKVASVDLKDAARRDTINSSIKFAGAFPQHEQAPVVLAAAVKSPDLRAEIRGQVESCLGKALRPDRVLFVAEIPKTRNAKVLRRVVRGAHLGLENLGDLSSLENPTAVEAIRGAT